MANKKWSQIINIGSLQEGDQLVGLRDGANWRFYPVNLQDAYNIDGNISLSDGDPINITDSTSDVALNLDPGSKKLRTEYTIEAVERGMTSHLINQDITSSLTISQNQLDRVNINSTANAYTYTLPLNDDFPNGSQFELLQFTAGGSITLNVPTGVFLNGIQNTSFILNTPFQRAGARRIAQNQWAGFIVEPSTSAEGIFTPNLSSISGISSLSAVSGMFSGNSAIKGSIITATIEFLIEPNGSGNNCVLSTVTPIPSNFGSALQAISCGEASIRPDTPDGSTGNIGSGALKTLFASLSNVVQIEIEFAQSIPYKVNLTYKYLVQ